MSTKPAAGQWKHSPRQYDHVGRVVTRIPNWGRKQAGKDRMHHGGEFRKVYKANLAEIVWTPKQREAVFRVAHDGVQRIRIAACETGLRPNPLVKLTRGQIEVTPRGRRISVGTNKRKRMATIPATPEMSALLHATPADRLISWPIPTMAGQRRAMPTTCCAYYRDKAGLTEEALGYTLRLRDCRGTTSTRLMNAGFSLAETASHMGWSVRWAAGVIEHHARVSPDESEAILVKFALSKGDAAWPSL